ncbi:hypothetical protein AB0F17_06555 [Nonomuraea sp. NPDC026600]|uniref:hypothetical protein n=1 Tax=Nonomuraea sp. NPDC026600 TaxID=3155363 RepID=UPI0033CB59A9
MGKPTDRDRGAAAPGRRDSRHFEGRRDVVVRIDGGGGQVHGPPFRAVAVQLGKVGVGGVALVRRRGLHDGRPHEGMPEHRLPAVRIRGQQAPPRPGTAATTRVRD